MIEDLIARLAIPGLPTWTGLLALLFLAVAGLAFLLMPFSVFGVKGRLDSIEAQLDDIQAEIRGLALRMTEGPTRAVVADEWAPPPGVAPPAAAPRMSAGPRLHPPVPPPPAQPSRREPRF